MRHRRAGRGRTSIRSAPPEASAVRRAMSRPRPVEPPPLRPARESVGNAGPVVGDGDRRAAAGPGPDVDDACRALGRVGEDVAEQRVDRGRQVAGRHADRQRPAGQVESTAAALVLGQHGPELAPARPTTARRVAAGAQALADRPPGLAITSSTPRLSASTSASSRSRSRRPGSASASSRSAVSGVRSRCARSAAASRSAVEQLADPAGQPVDRRRRPRAPPAGRPARPGRSGRRCPAGAAVAASSVTGRVSERASRSATSSASTQQHQRRARPAPARSGSRPRAAASAGTKTSITAVPSARRTGCTGGCRRRAASTVGARRGCAVGPRARGRRASCRRSSARDVQLVRTSPTRFAATCVRAGPGRPRG